MILVRNVFRLKFGQAKEAVAVWKEGMEMARKLGVGTDHRLLTDLAGAPFYTLVFEVTYSNLAEMEQLTQKAFGSEEWRAWYERFIPLAESGQREVFNIVG